MSNGRGQQSALSIPQSARARTNPATTYMERIGTRPFSGGASEEQRVKGEWEAMRSQRQEESAISDQQSVISKGGDEPRHYIFGR